MSKWWIDVVFCSTLLIYYGAYSMKDCGGNGAKRCTTAYTPVNCDPERDNCTTLQSNSTTFMHTTTGTPNTVKDLSDKTKGVAIAGIVVTVSVGLALGVMVLVLLKFRRDKRTNNKNHQSLPNTSYIDLNTADDYQHFNELTTGFNIPPIVNASASIKIHSSNEVDFSKRCSDDDGKYHNDKYNLNMSYSQINTFDSEDSNNYNILDPNETGYSRKYAFDFSTKYELAKPQSSQTGMKEGKLLENSNSYTLLDPNETGFSRTSRSDLFTNYEVSQPLTNDNCICEKTSQHSMTTNQANYTVLDPNATGFNRIRTVDLSVESDLPQPEPSKITISKNVLKDINHDEAELRKSYDSISFTSEVTNSYNVTTTRMLDFTNSVSKREESGNLYNHIGDTEYDTPIYRRKPDIMIDEYDHFTGH